MDSQVRRDGRAIWSDSQERMDFHMEGDDRLLATPIPSWDRARLKEEEWEQGWREKLQQGTFRLPSPPPGDLSLLHYREHFRPEVAEPPVTDVEDKDEILLHPGGEGEGGLPAQGQGS